MFKEGIIVFMMFAFLVGCSSKMVYMKGDDKANAVIEANMTGGRITLNGPFVYCSEPAVYGDPVKEVSSSTCIGIVGGAEEVTE